MATLSPLTRRRESELGKLAVREAQDVLAEAYREAGAVTPEERAAYDERFRAEYQVQEALMRVWVQEGRRLAKDGRLAEALIDLAQRYPLDRDEEAA